MLLPFVSALLRRISTKNNFQISITINVPDLTFMFRTVTMFVSVNTHTHTHTHKHTHTHTHILITLIYFFLCLRYKISCVQLQHLIYNRHKTKYKHKFRGTSMLLLHILYENRNNSIQLADSCSFIITQNIRIL